MNILAIATSGQEASVAIQFQDKVYSDTIDKPSAAAQEILPALDKLLKNTNISLASFSLLAVDIGPGSFTGVRVGVSAAQAIGYAYDLPIVGLSSLQILAQKTYTLYQTPQVLAANDARMQEVYWGRYELSPDKVMVNMQADEVSAPEKLILPDNTWVAAGNASLHYPVLAHLTPWYHVTSQASDMFFLAQQGFLQGRAVTAENLLPHYVRQKLAQKSRN
jgi:tRNA threonylcarbamoyladenosine biosynthesis protein TsaB